jgi:hypothetical protein
MQSYKEKPIYEARIVMYYYEIIVEQEDNVHSIVYNMELML